MPTMAEGVAAQVQEVSKGSLLTVAMLVYLQPVLSPLSQAWPTAAASNISLVGAVIKECSGPLFADDQVAYSGHTTSA